MIERVHKVSGTFSGYYIRVGEIGQRNLGTPCPGPDQWALELALRPKGTSSTQSSGNDAKYKGLRIVLVNTLEACGPADLSV